MQSSSAWIIGTGFLAAGAIVAAALAHPQSAPVEADEPPATSSAEPDVRTASLRLLAPTPPVHPAAEALPDAPSEPGAEVLVRQRVREAVSAEFDRRRPEAIARCFPERVASDSGHVTLQVVVDAEGREIARGFSESRELGPEISGCLRHALSAPVRIDAPGRVTDVEIPFP